MTRYVSTSVALAPSQVAFLKDWAERTDLSASQIVRRLVEAARERGGPSQPIAGGEPGAATFKDEQRC